MDITVKLHGILRDILPTELKGLTTLHLEADATLDTVLDWLNTHRVREPYEMAHNGDLIEDDEITLAEHDRIDVFPPSAGG